VHNFGDGTLLLPGDIKLEEMKKDQVRRDYV